MESRTYICRVCNLRHDIVEGNRIKCSCGYHGTIDSFRYAPGQKGSAAVKCIEISLASEKKGQKMITTLKDAKDNLEILYDEADEEGMTFRVVFMEEKEFNNLPEFMGW